MGQSNHGEKTTLTSAFSAGLATGLSNRELNKGESKFLRHVVGLTDRDVAHIAHDAKPQVKAQPYLLDQFDI